MARPDPAVSLRVSSRDLRRRGGDDGGPTTGPRLRLVVTRGRLAIELEQAFELSPLRIDQLCLSLPQVRFPVALSGGVAAFRHHRGELDRLEVRIPAAGLHKWAAGRLKGAIDGELRHHIVAGIEDGWLVGMASEQAALAFEVQMTPLGADLRLLPSAVRGVGLGAPPQAVAIRALHALVRPWGRLVGGAVLVPDAIGELCRQLLPRAGARVAATGQVDWTEIRQQLDGFTLVADREAAALAASPRTVSEIELAALVADAEAALLSGQMGTARSAYLAALGQAPRHPEIARRLAELDLTMGERAEAALSTLADALPAVDAGLLGGRLLAEVGDKDGARVAFERAAEQEPYGPMAARCWLEAAGLSEDLAARGAALDEAVARAPALEQARWLRFEHRVRSGSLTEARADIEHLEAEGKSALRRHLVLRRAGEFLLDQRALSQAEEVYERSLRYLPDSVEAVTGLARVFTALGKRERALELLSRAIGLAERRGERCHPAHLDYAIALAEVADDRPAAIAQVGAIESFTPGTFEARRLEARWRAELGDLAGASVALGRLAEATEAMLAVLVGDMPLAEGPIARLWAEVEGPVPAFYRRREDARAAIASMLEEGAQIQEQQRAELPVARRLLALALRLAPKRQRLAREFRRVAELVDAKREAASPEYVVAALDPAAEFAAVRRDAQPPQHEVVEPAAVVETQPPQHEVAPPERAPSEPASDSAEAPSGAFAPASQPLAMPDLNLLDDALGGDENADDELRAEHLGEQLRADPSNEAVASELAGLLESLGKDLELMALVSARLEEAGGELRPAWWQRRQLVLERLRAAAEAAGRAGEADLYVMMLTQEDEG